MAQSPGQPRFPLRPLNYLLHFASPASPKDYARHPIHTLKVGALGTYHALGLAKAHGSVFLLASTSEIYGDPEISPQPEKYWGHVNPIGPRSVYDEAKRFAEAISMAYHREHGVKVRIVRIFNTYGERMRLEDGRALPNFMVQALLGKPLTVYGKGNQTRSLCYVSDLVEGLYRLLTSDQTGPINLGNPEEVSILQLAEAIIRATGKQEFASSLNPCPRTIRSAASRISLPPAKNWAGSRASVWKTAWPKHSPIFSRRYRIFPGPSTRRTLTPNRKERTGEQSPFAVPAINLFGMKETSPSSPSPGAQIA